MKPVRRTLRDRKDRTPLTEEQILEIKETFELFDPTKKGSVDERQLKIAVRALGFETDDEEITELVKETMSKLECSLISYDVFYEVMAIKMKERDPIEEIRQNFKLLTGGSNQMEIKTLKGIVVELGENLTEDKTIEMFDECDVDKKGYITEEDFIKLMSE